MLNYRQDTSVKLAAGADHQPILDAMDAALQSQTPPRQSRNRARRITYRHRLDAVIRHPGGGGTKLKVSSRNLSTGGIAFLCEAFAHAGSGCTVTLMSPEHELVPVEGKVAHCHLVRGRVHEIGVRFDKPIHVGCFVDPESMSLSDLNPQDLTGRVLSLDTSPVQQELLRHFLTGTPVKLTASQNSEEAIQALASDQHDIFITDLYLDGADHGIAVIAKARASGFAGPILLATAETLADKHTQARIAGADYVLAKPYLPNALLAILERAHHDCGVAPDPHLIENANANRPEFRGVTAVFNTQAAKYALDIRKALSAGDADHLRRVCLEVKAAAMGVGYMNLAGAADSVFTAMQRSVSAARGPALRLAGGCQQLSKFNGGTPKPIANVA